MKNTFDTIEYLGKIGIYRESSLKCKVQVTGVAEESAYYRFQMTIIGKVCRSGKFMTLEDASINRDVNFGGALDYIILAKDYIAVTYVGKLDFSQKVIDEFEAAEALYNAQNP